MREEPTAFGWVDPETSGNPQWDAALIRRLARQLGYALVWPQTDSILPLVDQVRAADVDAVITSTPRHLDALTLDALMCIADVETACPRMSFTVWHPFGGRA